MIYGKLLKNDLQHSAIAYGNFFIFAITNKKIWIILLFRPVNIDLPPLLR